MISQRKVFVSCVVRSRSCASTCWCLLLHSEVHSVVVSLLEFLTLLDSSHLTALNERRRRLIMRIVPKKAPAPLRIRQKRVFTLFTKMKRCVRLNQTQVIRHRFHILIDDPLADFAWTVEYEKEMKENEKLEKELKHRLEGQCMVGFNFFFGVISLSITIVFALNKGIGFSYIYLYRNFARLNLLGKKVPYF